MNMRLKHLKINDAYTSDPQNPFIQILSSNEEMKKEAILSAKPYVANNFKECEGIEEYFQRIL